MVPRPALSWGGPSTPAVQTLHPQTRCREGEAFGREAATVCPQRGGSRVLGDRWGPSSLSSPSQVPLCPDSCPLG